MPIVHARAVACCPSPMSRHAVDPLRCRSSPGLHRFGIESKQTEFSSIPFQNLKEIIDSSYELEIDSALESVCHTPKFILIIEASLAPSPSPPPPEETLEPEHHWEPLPPSLKPRRTNLPLVASHGSFPPPKVSK
jgi:hypothetical protein